MTHGTGALESGYDIRDYWYEPQDGAGFDWKEGYDVEKQLGIKIVTKDQNGSSSCGGQAWSYYGEVLERVATGNYEPRSAKWIYSHTRSPDGAGSNGRVNSSFCIKEGWVSERLVPSYDDGKPPRESFFVKPIRTPEIKEEAQTNKALSFLGVTTNIEIVAQAIRDNYGCVLVVNGEDNGTWKSTHPRPPHVKEWGHFLYAGKARMIGGKKEIGVKNSWGDDTGEEGWQWLSEEWFVNPKLGVREGWTMQWDYRPAKIKLLMKEVIRLMQLLISKIK
jgi:hypothetical protein